MFVLLTLSTEKVQNKNFQIEKLIGEVSEGKTAPMRELYELIKTDVFAFALSKTGNKHDADDVTQETFVKIYRYAKQYTPKGKPMAWGF